MNIIDFLIVFAGGFIAGRMWQVHLDRQLIQYKVCQDYGCAR